MAESGSRKPSRRQVGWAIGFIIAVVIGAGIFVLLRVLPVVDAPRFLTTSESQLVATSRFQNYDIGTREIDIRIEANGGVMTATGLLDYETGAGIVQISGEYQGSGIDGSRESGPTNLIWWNYEVLGELDQEGAVLSVPEALKSLDANAGWRFVAREEVLGTDLGALLILAAGYGSDRPDNPKLIEQSDAVRLGSVDLQEDGPGLEVQLPSADEVRAPGLSPQENPALPRVVINQRGVATRLMLGAEGASSSILNYGNSSDFTVPAVVFGETPDG